MLKADWFRGRGLRLILYLHPVPEINKDSLGRKKEEKQENAWYEERIIWCSKTLRKEIYKIELVFGSRNLRSGPKPWSILPYAIKKL